MASALETIAEFWEAFSRATGVAGPYTAWAFGADNDPRQQTRLGTLVLEGPKRATAGRLADHDPDTDPVPRPGDYSVILDGEGAPLCIIETTRVEIRRFDDVDEDFAWTEGEGDRTLAWWRDAHSAFFAGIGTPIDGDTPLVLEWFDLVWPPG